MGSVVNFADAVRAAIEAGTEIEGTVVRVIADNGATIGSGTTFEVIGGNGVASTVTAMAQTAGSTTTTTGLAFLSVDLGIAGAAIAPALGVLAGVGLYNLAPSFWDTVSNALMEAGQTIGGKIVAYTDGHNLFFDNHTIEIFKNSLLDAGMFEYMSSIENMTIDDVTYGPVPTSALPYRVVSYIDPQFGPVTGGMDLIEYSEPVRFWAWKPRPDGDYDVYVVSRAPFTLKNWTRYGGNYYEQIISGSEITFHGHKIYRIYTGFDDSFISPPIRNIYVMPENGDVTAVNYIVAYNDARLNLDILQNDAKYPSSGEQFPLTYPQWYPFNYPEIDPTGLPTVYPLKYPEIKPIEYPKQDEAQDPEEEDDDEFYPVIVPDFPMPDPGTGGDDDEDTEDDPDDDFDDPDPIPDVPDPIPRDDPIDPNPDDPDTPVIIDPDDPDTVQSTRLFTVYNPSEANLNSLGAYLWDDSIMASLRNIWQDPLDGVISLIQVYVTPSTSGSHNIILGYLDTGVSSPVVSSQFVTIDCGSVSVPESKENATDYAPYTSLHLFLPFIGIVELDSNECMNSTIKVVYKVDVYTGTCLAQVKVTRTKDMPHGPIIYTFSGNCSQQIPLTSGNATGVLTALIGGITAGIGAASGGGIGLMAGAEIVGRSVTHEMFHINHSGNISANAGIMGNKKPYLIIGRRHGYDANNYSSFYGYPANKTVYLGNHSGFVRVKKCFVKTSATQPEHDLIMELLKDGVIL